MMRIDANSETDLNISLLLQRGVYVEMPDTEFRSVSGFVSAVLAMSPEQIEREIKTIFLNNRVVDDPEALEVRPGDTLILSGAMPGLVGAMLRSDSPLKAMRDTITADGAGATPATPAADMVRLKLFNTVLLKRRRAILNHGFYIEETAE